MNSLLLYLHKLDQESKSKSGSTPAGRKESSVLLQVKNPILSTKSHDLPSIDFP